MKNKRLLATLFISAFISIQGISAQNNTNSSKQVKELIAKKRAYNKEFGFGYRIQIYYGNETKAKSLRNKFRIEFPGTYNILEYDQPYWKVQVGNYKTKLEADKSLVIFKEKFSGIIVIPMGK
ncbi:SPOR domain-containing protein [Polaribacter pectinis]|uniref:SPOR domain-containing protein n=1 Tax=Polaribacter pectinis TaxID=2738844 RepID=A0A7G9LA40_9FLAO|nr:SPOR domain-containing protein [Polaribacter pectinis]QNM85489.1 SPOR domain-containing protein [Polaribacter pectinis]